MSGMDRTDHVTTLVTQVLSLPAMAGEQLPLVFADLVERFPIPKCRVRRFERVYITGCGDSYPAAGAAALLFRRLTGIRDCAAFDPMTFSRILRREAFGERDRTLTVVVSVKGGTVRVPEMIQKARAAGSPVLLVTDKEESRASIYADYLFLQRQPPMRNAIPGLRSYFTSLSAALAAACAIGRIRGELAKETVEELVKAALSYAKAFGPHLEQYDEAYFEAARRLKDVDFLYLLAEGPSRWSMEFSAMKFYECAGLNCCCGGFREWERYFREAFVPGRTGLLLCKNPQDSDETVTGILTKLPPGTPAFLLSNDPGYGAPAGIRSFFLPAAPEGYEFLRVLMEYCPASLVAGYQCSVSNRKKNYVYHSDTGKFSCDDPRFVKFFDPAHKSHINGELRICL